jgi:hypothetical protein
LLYRMLTLYSYGLRVCSSKANFAIPPLRETKNPQ